MWLDIFWRLWAKVGERRSGRVAKPSRSGVCGGSAASPEYRASLPILLVAEAISVGAVMFQETLLPDINARSEEVDRVKIRGQLPRHLQRQTQIWYRSSDTRFFRMALGWQLTDGVFRRVGPQNRITSEMFDSRLLSMPEHIDDFIQVQNAPDTMSFLELRAYVARLRDGGTASPATWCSSTPSSPSRWCT